MTGTDTQDDVVAVGDAPLVIEDRAEVRRITFNRPAVHNAQNVAMLELLDAALDDLRWNRHVRVVILEGAGRSFCSGHDLKEMGANPNYRANAATAEGRYWQELRLFVEPVRKFRELPIPTICRVQGNCLAAGLMFVAAADFVVASTDAIFGSPVLAKLAVADAESPDFLLRVGERRAKEVMWLDQRFDAEAAKAMDLVNWVVSLEDLDAKCDEVAGRLMASPREALALSKEVFSFMFDAHGRTTSRYHYLAHQLTHHTSEARDLLAARLAEASGS